jgi:hypothetical protein
MEILEKLDEIGAQAVLSMRPGVGREDRHHVEVDRARAHVADGDLELAKPGRDPNQPIDLRAPQAEKPGSLGPVVVTSPQRRPIKRAEPGTQRVRSPARVSGRPRVPAVAVPAVTDGQQASQTPLNTNVVTEVGSRLGLTVRQTPATVEVIDKQVIEDRGLRTTTDIAKAAVGVTGGDAPGAPAIFSMRGFAGDQINVSGIDANTVLESLAELRRTFHIDEAAAYVMISSWGQAALEARRLWNWRVVYDCMDEWENFPGIKRQLLDMEVKLVESCDLLVVTAQRLYDKWRRYQRFPVLARNAVDYDFYAENYRPNRRLQDIKHPIVGYYGAIAVMAAS